MRKAYGGAMFTTKVPKLPLTSVFYWINAVTMQYGGHLLRQTTHAVHEHVLLPKPRQTKEEARALLCAPETEDTGFGFILGKRGSPSWAKELWHGHRQRQHTHAQSCQTSAANSTAKPSLGSESWGLGFGTARGEK